MGNYVDRIQSPPRTLTIEEQAAILRVTGAHRRGFRDHLVIALALGTGLRAHEIAGLDVRDIADEQGTVRRRVRLRVFKRSNIDLELQQVALGDRLRAKLRHFLGWKERHGQDLAPEAPLFVSRKGNRLSTRQMRTSFSRWQERAGVERRYSFHCLRHTACTSHYRRCKDLRLTQLFARHVSATTTQMYTHPTQEDLLASVQDLLC